MALGFWGGKDFKKWAENIGTSNTRHIEEKAKKKR